MLQPWNLSVKISPRMGREVDEESTATSLNSYDKRWEYGGPVVMKDYR
jgi:hypothetical protein